MKLSGALFDLDGTLLDTVPLFLAAYRFAFFEFTGRSFSDGEILSLSGPSEEGIIQKVVPDNWKRCLDLYVQYELSHLESVKAFSGLSIVLELLNKRNVKMAVITGRKNNAHKFLDHTGLTPYFDEVETGSTHGSSKQTSIEHIIGKWNYPPQQLIYVGDTAYEMAEAQKTGVLPIRAKWSSYLIDNGSQTNIGLEFNSVADFSRWVNEIALQE